MEHLADIYGHSRTFKQQVPVPFWARSTSIHGLGSGGLSLFSFENSSAPSVPSNLFQVAGSTNLTFAAEKGFVTLPSIMNSHGRILSGGYRAHCPCITRVARFLHGAGKRRRRRRIRGHAMTRNDVRRDATGTDGHVLNRATAEGGLDRAPEAAFSRCCVYDLVAAAFAGDEDGHRDDDADADAARSNHGATRKPPERPHLFHPPATSAPRRFISLQPPSARRSSPDRSVQAISPPFYRSYGRGPPRSICLVRAETLESRSYRLDRPRGRATKENGRQFAGGLIPLQSSFLEAREIGFLIDRPAVRRQV